MLVEVEVAVVEPLSEEPAATAPMAAARPTVTAMAVGVAEPSPKVELFATEPVAVPVSSAIA